MHRGGIHEGYQDIPGDRLGLIEVKEEILMAFSDSNETELSVEEFEVTRFTSTKLQVHQKSIYK